MHLPLHFAARRLEALHRLVRDSLPRPRSDTMPSMAGRVASPVAPAALRAPAAAS